MNSAISLVPIDPYKVPSSETATGIFNSIDSKLFATSIAADFLSSSAA